MIFEDKKQTILVFFSFSRRVKSSRGQKSSFSRDFLGFRNAEYGSTVSSLTQSSNMKTEVSDIDFSWVNDVENRLDREIAFVKEGNFTIF